MSNWKIEKDGETFIKVISFPTPGHFGESMWVKKVGGTDNDGTGTLSNEPAFCEVASFGDLIRYEGGTSEEKPRFAEVLTNW